MIRHWAEVMGDENPVYTDEAFAAASSKRGIIVQRRYTLASCADGPKCPSVTSAKLGNAFGIAWPSRREGGLRRWPWDGLYYVSAYAPARE